MAAENLSKINEIESDLIQEQIEVFASGPRKVRDVHHDVPEDVRTPIGADTTLLRLKMNEH